MLLTHEAPEHYQNLDESRSRQFQAEIGAMEARIRAEMHMKISKSELGSMKWLFFVYWVSTMLGMGALITALTK